MNMNSMSASADSLSPPPSAMKANVIEQKNALLYKSENNRTCKMYLHVRWTWGRLDSLSSPCSWALWQPHFQEIGSQFYFFPDKISCNVQIAVPEMDTRRRRRQACQLVGGKSKCQKYGGERKHAGSGCKYRQGRLSAQIIKLMHKSVLVPPHNTQAMPSS